MSLTNVRAKFQVSSFTFRVYANESGIFPIVRCSSHRHRLRHDKVVICWQLKVLLIVQLIDVIN